MAADFGTVFHEFDYDANKLMLKTDANELIARKYLAAGLLDQARTAAEQAKDKLFKTTYNPFTAGRSGNNRVKSKAMTLLDVLDTLQKLEDEASKNPTDAQTQFLLGTAYYNLTWFGNSPNLIRVSRSTISWKNGETDFSKARQHYERALQQTTDRELKAKTLYALAKIEHNEFDMQHEDKITELRTQLASGTATNYSTAVTFAKENGLGTYFKQIRAYEDTQYFKDVIKQCADYRYYFAQ
jgi:tetratricopeptide (TPR) repeat protein